MAPQRAETTEPATGAMDAKVVERVARAHQTLTREVHKVIIGQDVIIDQLVIGLFSRGHCLVVGVPGLAKTLMVQTIAQVFDLKFSRIQFTPDLMPSDITGTEIIEEDPSTGKRVFRFIKGPIFGNIVLADEINRTPPKTQAALLQAMQEYQVTAGGETYPLQLPFFVLATQNPIEQEGTYPLPEAQLDRFMFMLYIDYPSREEERLIVKSTTYDVTRELKTVLSGRDLVQIQQLVRRVPVSDHIVNYAVELCRATRPGEKGVPKFISEWLTWGVGPRAAQNLVVGAKARAVLKGRYNVHAEDIRAMAKPVLRHRMFTNFNADAEGITTDRIVDELLKIGPEPSAKDYGGS